MARSQLRSRYHRKSSTVSNRWKADSRQRRRQRAQTDYAGGKSRTFGSEIQMTVCASAEWRDRWPLPCVSSTNRKLSAPWSGPLVSVRLPALEPASCSRAGSRITRGNAAFVSRLSRYTLVSAWATEGKARLNGGRLAIRIAGRTALHREPTALAFVAPGCVRCPHRLAEPAGRSPVLGGHVRTWPDRPNGGPTSWPEVRSAQRR
jgi:hypothetical protein